MVDKSDSESVVISSLADELHGYTSDTFRHDLTAALTVALLAIPQAMAYALVANLPPAAGLFAAVFGAIFGGAFGSSKHLVIGPTNAIAVLIQAGTAEILYNFYQDATPLERNVIAMQLVTQIGFLAGIFQILAGYFKLGKLTQFVSRSVVIGYICGAAMAIAVNQLFTFFGLNKMEGVHSLFSKILYVFSHVGNLDWHTTIIGVFSLSCLILMKGIKTRFPKAVIVLILAAVLVQVLGWSPAEWVEGQSSVVLVRDYGEIHLTSVRPTIPFFDLQVLNSLLPLALMIALLSVLEASSVAKSISATSGQRFEVNQEIFGLGMGNVFSSLLGAMAVSGSPSRSALNLASGAQTRMATILGGVVVAAILLFLGGLVTYIPLASLAALLLFTSAGMVDAKQFRLSVWTTGSDALVLAVTVLSSFFLSLDLAFFLGVTTSVTLYLRKAANPSLVEYGFNEAGEFKPLSSAESRPNPEICLVNIEGDLFFGSADLFQASLKTLARDQQIRVLILHMRNARHMDATSCFALQQLHEYLESTGRHLILAGVTRWVYRVIIDSGIDKVIGKDNISMFEESRPRFAAMTSFIRAKELVLEDKKRKRESIPTVIIGLDTKPIPVE